MHTAHGKHPAYDKPKLAKPIFGEAVSAASSPIFLVSVVSWFQVNLDLHKIRITFKVSSTTLVSSPTPSLAFSRRTRHFHPLLAYNRIGSDCARSFVCILGHYRISWTLISPSACLAASRLSYSRSLPMPPRSWRLTLGCIIIGAFSMLIST